MRAGLPAVALALAGWAVLCWPVTARRLRQLAGGTEAGRWPSGFARAGPASRPRPVSRVWLTGPAGRAVVLRGWSPPSRLVALAGAATAGGLGGLAGGAASGVSAAMLGATAAVLVTRAIGRRRVRSGLAEIAVGLRLLCRELAAGASASSAVRAVVDTGGGAGDLLAGLAAELDAGVFVGPDPPAGETATVARAAGAEDAVTGVVRRLRAVWLMSARFGIPLAAAVRTLAEDVEDRRAAMDRRATQTAGPALSGYLLAGLPVAGVLLGAAMGADPVHVLTATTLGGMLLLVGCALTCAGLLWSARLAGGAAG